MGLDHLHGRLFIDYLSLLKRRSALNAWEKQRGKYPDNLRRLDLSADVEDGANSSAGDTEG